MKQIPKHLIFFLLLLGVPVFANAALECRMQNEGAPVLINTKTDLTVDAAKALKSTKRKFKRAKANLASVKQAGGSKAQIKKAKNKVKRAKANRDAASDCQGDDSGSSSPKGEARLQVGDGDVYFTYRYFIHKAGVSNKACSVVGFIEFVDDPELTVTSVGFTSLSRSPVGENTLSTSTPFNDTYRFTVGFNAPGVEHTFDAPSDTHQVVFFSNTFFVSTKATLADCDEQVGQFAATYEDPLVNP